MVSLNHLINQLQGKMKTLGLRALVYHGWLRPQWRAWCTVEGPGLSGMLGVLWMALATVESLVYCGGPRHLKENLNKALRLYLAGVSQDLNCTLGSFSTLNSQPLLTSPNGHSDFIFSFFIGLLLPVIAVSQSAKVSISFHVRSHSWASAGVPHSCEKIFPNSEEQTQPSLRSIFNYGWNECSTSMLP